MSKGILLIGGGGHCRSVLDSLCNSGIYDRIGVIAKDEVDHRELEDDGIISGYLAGIDEDLTALFSDGWTDAFITLGSIGDPTGRKRIYTLLKQIGFRIPAVMDRSAVVSARSRIGPGVFVGKNAVINIGSVIGKCVIINTGAIIEHDCDIGDFVHISPGAVLCGQATIGNGSHIGAGSVVRQGIRIGMNVLVGAGSVVVKDLSDDITAYGNPCRVGG